jgi:hypothetical protein
MYWRSVRVLQEVLKDVLGDGLKKVFASCNMLGELFQKHTWEGAK